MLGAWAFGPTVLGDVTSPPLGVGWGDGHGSHGHADMLLLALSLSKASRKSVVRSGMGQKTGSERGVYEYIIRRRWLKSCTDSFSA